MRAFLAIELPSAVRRRLGEVQRALAEAENGWRWSRPESIHLTLRFLGDVAPEDVVKAKPGWRAAASSVAAFTIHIAGLGAFPSQRRPRVIWAGIVEEPPTGRLFELAQRFDAASPFTPHLTLARAADHRARMPSSRESVDCGTAAVSEVVLFQSQLRPQGALHTALERFLLGAGDR